MGRDATMNKHVLAYSIIEVLYGLVFWSWAVYNMVSGVSPFDSGAVVFIFAIVAGVTGLVSLMQADRILLNVHVWSIYVGHVLIPLAYLYGAFIGFKDNRIPFGIYCAVAAFLWIALSVWVVPKARAYRKSIFEDIEKQPAGSHHGPSNSFMV